MQKRLKVVESELMDSRTKLSVYEQIDSNVRLTTLQEDVEPELVETKRIKERCEDLEREIKVLKNQNQSELSMRVISLEQQVEDGKREVERVHELYKLTENRMEKLKREKLQIQDQVEERLTASNDNMGAILQENKNILAKNEELVKKSEMLKVAGQKIQSLEKQLTETKELLQSAENAKRQTMLEKSDLEDKEFNL